MQELLDLRFAPDIKEAEDSLEHFKKEVAGQKKIKSTKKKHSLKRFVKKPNFYLVISNNKAKKLLS